MISECVHVRPHVPEFCLTSIQDVTVTNDGATILSLLDIEHPAGKILVDLAQQQDKEVSSLVIAQTPGKSSSYCCII